MTDRIPPKPFDPDWVVTPGLTLADCMKEHEHTSSWLAYQVGCNVEDIEGVLKGDVKITPMMAIRFGEIYKTGDRFWMNRQRHFDEGVARGKKVTR